MSQSEKADNQANERKERLKNLAVVGGESMFIAFCSTVGMLLATVMVENFRNRSSRES